MSRSCRANAPAVVRFMLQLRRPLSLSHLHCCTTEIDKTRETLEETKVHLTHFAATALTRSVPFSPCPYTQRALFYSPSRPSSSAARDKPLGNTSQGAVGAWDTPLSSAAAMTLMDCLWGRAQSERTAQHAEPFVPSPACRQAWRYRTAAQSSSAP